jgi:hypothetical protein
MMLSAQVVLRAASGKRMDGTAAITAANIAEYLPAPATVSAARQAFSERGFRVGEVAGNSFPITASEETFEKVFHTKLRKGQKGEVTVGRKKGTASYELPLTQLPESVKRYVEAVTFSPPPDFGPTGY